MSLPEERWPPRIGILGGGQLGLMMLQAASDWHLTPTFLDPDPEASVKPYGLCVAGDFRDFQTVLDFGKDKDLISYEIEQVNLEALQVLEREGKRVFPPSRVLEIIRDKGTQKEFLRREGFPTPDWIPFQGPSPEAEAFLPAFWKQRQGGYDGKGVREITRASDLAGLPDLPAFLEKAVAVDKELAVLVSRNAAGEMAVFPVVEMVFHPGANLVDYLLSPARIDPELETRCRRMAEDLAEKLGLVGLLAVELFLDRGGRILVNEMAPRPHNSGHHTIEGNGVSQFAQFWRAILGWPPGDTRAKVPYSAMVNLVGEEGFAGPPVYHGMPECLALPGVQVHLYGKSQTRPFRKMGHVSILADTLAELEQKVSFVKNQLRSTT